MVAALGQQAPGGEAERGKQPKKNRHHGAGVIFLPRKFV
jgi:hypothetical protein